MYPVLSNANLSVLHFIKVYVFKYANQFLLRTFSRTDFINRFEFGPVNSNRKQVTMYKETRKEQGFLQNQVSWMS